MIQQVPDEVLREVAKLAGIHEVGGLGDLGLPERREKFYSEVITGLLWFQYTAAIKDALETTAHKKIAFHAGELIKYLKASNEKDLSYHLLLHDADADYVKLLDCLARAAESVGEVKVTRPHRWMITNWRVFVERLLDAAASAGGRFTINRTKEGGTLVDALQLLRPYLPKGSMGMALITLRRIYDPWREKAPQKYPWLKNSKNGARKSKK